MFSKNFKYDLKSGFSVFLLALPLCLGISIASNFPPIAGILTAIVGGLIASFFGSSRLTIKGPAAGLIVIALGAVNDLGGGDVTLGYKRALAVGVVAAIIQILFALFRMAKFAEIMPPSVIHGMLAAIGIIIIAKQSTVFLGVQGVSGSPLKLISMLPENIKHLNPEITLIALISLFIILTWPTFKKLKSIPASIIVLVATIPLSIYFDIAHPHAYHLFNSDFNIGPDFLVNLPGSLLNAATFPLFDVITSVYSIKYIVLFALVGSIESLLTVCAVDNLDPEKKQSDLNKDLLATGVGNLIASLIGGLPMISEIVRSKANIDYEAKSKYSNFFHGLFLLVSIVFIPQIIHQISFSALAALLIFTGFRLASPHEFKKVFQIGFDQFFLFMLTLIVTLLTDLLLGVTVGIIAKVLLHLIRGASLSDFFSLKHTVKENEKEILVKVTGAVVFTNFLTLKNIIQNGINNKKMVKIDLSDAIIVDHTIQEKLHLFKNNVILQGISSLHAISTHEFSFKKR